MTDVQVDALVRASFEVAEVLSYVAKRHAIPVTLLRLGGILRDRTPSMADVARHLGLDKSTITGIVDAGEQRGILRRITDAADGRSTRVELTAEGHALARTCEAQVAERVEPILARLRSQL